MAGVTYTRPGCITGVAVHGRVPTHSGEPTLSSLLAAEGGYQEFSLHGGEWLILIGSALTALLALAVGFYLVKGVLAADAGTPKMQEIALAIQEGAWAYLKRQFLSLIHI